MAASTSRVYGSGLNQYLAFCREVGIPHPFPFHEFVLELFVALRGTRLSVATLRTYLAGLQHFSFRFGFPTKVPVCILSGLCCAASAARRPIASPGHLGDRSRLPP